MKTLILLLILLPATSGAATSYYNQYGTYEGNSVTNGPYTTYYDYRGNYLGNAVTTPPNPAPVYTPRIELAPIPGTYDGITPPGIEMIGVPE